MCTLFFSTKKPKNCFKPQRFMMWVSYLLLHTKGRSQPQFLIAEFLIRKKSVVTRYRNPNLFKWLRHGQAVWWRNHCLISNQSIVKKWSNRTFELSWTIPVHVITWGGWISVKMNAPILKRPFHFRDVAIAEQAAPGKVSIGGTLQRRRR